MICDIAVFWSLSQRRLPGEWCNIYMTGPQDVIMRGCVFVYTSVVLYLFEPSYWFLFFLLVVRLLFFCFCLLLLLLLLLLWFFVLLWHLIYCFYRLQFCVFSFFFRPRCGLCNSEIQFRVSGIYLLLLPAQTTHQGWLKKRTRTKKKNVFRFSLQQNKGPVTRFKPIHTTDTTC